MTSERLQEYGKPAASQPVNEVKGMNYEKINSNSKKEPTDIIACVVLTDKT